jgi:hypothetical protein
MTQVASRRDASGRYTVLGPSGVTIATLEPNQWETRFFGRRMGCLALAAEAAAALEPPAWQQAVSLIAAESDAYDLVQIHLDVRPLALAPALEDVGFRLVDTRISFLTRLDSSSVARYEPPVGVVRPARPGDLADLLVLTHRRLTHNPGFHSRYKTPAFFTPEETARWFTAWVENDLADPRSRMAVWVVDGRPVGFFGYQRQDDREGLPFYKSTVAAVDEDRGGQNAHMFLQTILFDGMPAGELWVENTTQLTNSPIIHNNLLLGRRLDRIELTFFRTPRA